MTFLYVCIAIIVAIIILLSIKFTIVAEYYDNELTIIVKWLLFKVRLYPPKPEKERKKKKKKRIKQKKEKVKKKQKTNPLKDFIKEQGFRGTVQLIKDIAKMTTSAAKNVLKRIVIKELYVDLTVASEDAAKTAILYGKTCSAVFPAMSLICSVMKVRKYDVQVNPDFLANKSLANFRTQLYLRPILVVNTAIVFIFKFIYKILYKLFFSKNKTNKDNMKNEKAGVKK